MILLKLSFYIKSENILILNHNHIHQGPFCSGHGVLNLCSPWACHACSSKSYDSDL